MKPLPEPVIGVRIYETDQEAPDAKRRAAVLAYCKMLINLYREREREKAESNGSSLGVL